MVLSPISQLCTIRMREAKGFAQGHSEKTESEPGLHPQSAPLKSPGFLKCSGVASGEDCSCDRKVTNPQVPKCHHQSHRQDSSQMQESTAEAKQIAPA